MKLSNRTSIYFTVLSLLIFSIGGLVFYYEIRTNTRQDADERLGYEKQKVVNYLQEHNALPPETLSLGDSIAFHPIPAPPAGYQTLSGPNEWSDRVKDTILYSKYENEREPHRMIKFTASDNSGYYRVMIFKPLIETDDLTNAIIESIGIIAIALIVVLVLANNFIIRKVWNPFYTMLNEIEAFDIAKGKEVKFEDSSIEEFHELKLVLEKMTDKISSDYRNLKEFTENASHEIQTPLAVIQAKLELLIQSENLTAEQAENVKAIYAAATKLSKLNQALLLLAKIENQQFVEKKDVAVNDLVESKLEAFEELIQHKNIEVEVDYQHVVINMHPILADILITNLVNNAIKHNINGGKIHIEVVGKKLLIQNSGAPISIPGEALFERFKKSSQASDSHGLGLAIVKEICKVYGFDIQYDYRDTLHTVTVNFT